MFGVVFEEITERHLQSLISEKIPEDSSVEYKRELPGSNDASKHEFLADVSGLANHHGGYIFFGIDEDGQGCPLSINPQSINPDKECLRLQDVVRNNLEPKLNGCKIRAVSLESGGYVVVINVPQSWSKPHRVRTNNHFFIREGARKRQLEMPEIKMAFINSEQPKKRILDFRSERISKILSGETPIKMMDGLIQVLHVLPASAFLNDFSVDVFAALDRTRIPVMSRGDGLNWRINVDGVLMHRVVTERGSGAYTQIFRNGFVESVRVFPKSIETGRIVLPSTAYELDIINYVKQIKIMLKELGVDGPLVFLYSLLNANGVQFGVSNSFFLDEGQGNFDRAQILFPDLLIEEWESDEGKFLRQLFDLVWNAAGFRESGNYDKKSGIWCGMQP